MVSETRSSTQSVKVEEREIVIDAADAALPYDLTKEPWLVVSLTCEVSCETGLCPHSGPWGESEIDTGTCVLVVELEGPHGEVEEKRTFYGERAYKVLCSGSFDLYEEILEQAMEKHEGL